MDNENIEQITETAEPEIQQVEQPEAPDQNDEITALRGELMELKLRLALLAAGAAPEKLDEGVRLAKGLMAADGGEPENAAEVVLREYPHIKLAKRVIPQLSAESAGCGDGFAAIRNIFAKR